MKIIKSALFIFSLFFLTIGDGTLVEAAPAMPFFQTAKQPDGTEFKARLRGDEWFNWIETYDEKIIVHNRNSGFYEYAEIKNIEGREQLAPSGRAVKEGDLFKSHEQLNIKQIPSTKLNQLRKSAIEKRNSFQQKFRRKN